MRQVLVAGGFGVAGRGILNAVARTADFKAVALSRCAEAPGTARHIAVDLTDRADAEAKLGGLNGITHIFFAAYLERPSPRRRGGTQLRHA
jgi:hypothetical protein